jgi:hypothetical protein
MGFVSLNPSYGLRACDSEWQQRLDVVWSSAIEHARYEAVSNITIPKSRKLEFENRLMEYQRVHNRGQFGVSVILGATSEDIAGNVTYFSLPEKIALSVLESSGIPYTAS